MGREFQHSENLKSDRVLIEEIAARARRTETKVTMMSEHFGLETGADKPVFNRETGTLTLTSRRVTLAEIMAAVPSDHRGGYRIYVKDDWMMTVLL